MLGTRTKSFRNKKEALMKKALIIHGWESHSRDHWFQEEKSILESLGYMVEVPDMPNTFHPKKDEWVKVIEDFDPDENSVLIRHSLGAPAILRYLEKAKKKVGKAFLLAGFSKPLGTDFEAVTNFVQEPFDWDKITANAGQFIIINQKDDPYVPIDAGKEAADKTEGKFVLVEGNNHFDKMDLNLINKYL